MYRFAIWQQPGFGKFVKRIESNLGHEQQEKNSSYLEKSTDVNQMSETRPRPGHRACRKYANERTPNQLGSVNLQQHEGGFHPEEHVTKAAADCQGKCNSPINGARQLRSS